MATVKVRKRGTLKPRKAVEYARAVKAAHDYQRQQRIMLDMLVGFEASNGVDEERIKMETLERIKSFDDGSDKKERKGRKKK
jgi:hypothetical protein